MQRNKDRKASVKQVFGQYAQKQSEMKGAAVFAWGRFIRKLTLRENQRKLNVNLRWRKLATDYLVLHENYSLFK